MSENGLMHVYFGDGKGKTTAALGLAIRAAGCGKKVVIVQFLKNWACGEHDSISQLPNITLFRGIPAGGKFIHEMSAEEVQETKASQDDGFKNALELIEIGQCDMLVLDEVIDAHRLEVLDDGMFKNLIFNKPSSLELVITGHNPGAFLLERADYVTEMVKHKHPYDEGTSARRGVEF
ncbi:MAG: cob(I)yrinic acid a,c-diamide adenosyltransferase [Oscillospiraceae bacterium]|nr:cob(I)yrinic acid a,c-diamide adenosyltransferase [Oscillospiraceae bacterium]